MDDFIPVFFSKIYKKISQKNESVSLSYISQLEDKIIQIFLMIALERIRFFNIQQLVLIKTI